MLLITKVPSVHREQLQTPHSASAYLICGAEKI